MKQRQGGVIGRATISGLLLTALLVPGTGTIQRFGGAERNPKRKPAAKADFLLSVEDNLVSLTAKTLH